VGGIDSSLPESFDPSGQVSSKPGADQFASKAGTPLRPENFYRRALAPAAIGAGFKVEVNGKKKTQSAVSFHTFRHTCASLLFEAGWNVKQVQAWLGHADPGFTLSTYIHLMDAGVGSPAFLDQVIGEIPTRTRNLST
jgi:integrase